MTTFATPEDRAKWLEAQIDWRVAELRLLAAKTAVDYGRENNQKTVAERFDAALRKRGYYLGPDGSVRPLRPRF